MRAILCMLILAVSSFAISLNINPVCDTEDVQIDTVFVISVLISELEMGIPVPVPDAVVCIWNQDGNDVFAIGRTNSSGVIVFTDLEISQTGELTVTATKRRDGFDVAAYLPL